MTTSIPYDALPALPKPETASQSRPAPAIIPDGARYLDECYQEQPFPDDGAYTPLNYDNGIYYPDFYSDADEFADLTQEEIAAKAIAEGWYSPLLFDNGIYYPEAHTANPLDMMQYGPTAYMQSAIASWLDDPMTLVAADTFIYYDQDDTSARVGPDVFVIPGVAQEPPQRSYYLWREGWRYPTLVVEILSRRTYRRDLTFKRELYESWGVSEYILHDPNHDMPDPLLLPPVALLRMGPDGRYYGVESQYDAERDVYIVYSEVLGLEVHGKRDWLRLYNPATGEYLPDYQELEQARQEAVVQQATTEAQLVITEAQRDAEQQARQEAEAEIARLRAEIARLQPPQP